MSGFLRGFFNIVASEAQQPERNVFSKKSQSDLE